MPCSETVPETASKKARHAPGTSNDPTATPGKGIAGEGAGGDFDTPSTADVEMAAGKDRTPHYLSEMWGLPELMRSF